MILQYLNVLDTMKLSFIMTVYNVEFMALNDMRIGKCLALQSDNIDCDKATLEIDGTVHRG